MAFVSAIVPQMSAVLTVSDLRMRALSTLAAQYNLSIVKVGDDQTIPGSFWGEPEAGLVGRDIFVRGDTPLHSLLHELSHVVCMDPARRAELVRDAGGDDDEESAVCYLQILLADELAGIGRQRLMHDMDAWGYSFRLGSTQRWFDHDADEARQWLLHHDLLTPAGQPAFRLRSA